MKPLILIMFSCPLCGCRDVPVNVPERGDEDVVKWLRSSVDGYVKKAHVARSPTCPARTVDLKIPMEHRPKVGGPIQH